jgi:hypothetical protein
VEEQPHAQETCHEAHQKLGANDESNQGSHLLAQPMTNQECPHYTNNNACNHDLFSLLRLINLYAANTNITTPHNVSGSTTNCDMSFMSSSCPTTHSNN